MAYAEEHWPEELTLDNWVDVQTVYVMDPKVLIPVSSTTHEPQTKFAISVCLGRSWNDLINDRSKPRVQHWDDAILVADIDRLLFAELKGNRGGFTAYNCAQCGGGLGAARCNSCGISFPEDRSRCPNYTSLPSKLIKLLRDSGHVFGLDPERLLIG